MAVFASRQIVIPDLSIPVTITGTGDSRYRYATINGTKQYSAGTHEVNAGDTITFGVYGTSSSSSAYGSLTIDGTEVLHVTDKTTQTYEWTVPRGISTIGIAMEINGFLSYGTITVTTA